MHVIFFFRFILDKRLGFGCQDTIKVRVSKASAPSGMQNVASSDNNIHGITCNSRCAPCGCAGFPPQSGGQGGQEANIHFLPYFHQFFGFRVVACCLSRVECEKSSTLRPVQ